MSTSDNVLTHWVRHAQITLTNTTFITSKLLRQLAIDAHELGTLASYQSLASVSTLQLTQRQRRPLQEAADPHWAHLNAVNTLWIDGPTTLAWSQIFKWRQELVQLRIQYCTQIRGNPRLSRTALQPGRLFGTLDDVTVSATVASSPFASLGTQFVSQSPSDTSLFATSNPTSSQEVSQVASYLTPTRSTPMPEQWSEHRYAHAKMKAPHRSVTAPHFRDPARKPAGAIVSFGCGGEVLMMFRKGPIQLYMIE